MSLIDSVEASVGRARQRLAKLRLRYMDAIHQAERHGGSRLEEIKRQFEQLGPELWQRVDGQVEALQNKLDELNQRLAEEAVPEERKSRVGRLDLERKAASAAKLAGSVVRSRTRAKVSGESAPKPSSSRTPETSKAASKGASGNADQARVAHKSRRGPTSGKSGGGARKKSRKSS
ncbi:hypothetical protein RE428_30230 [Marinobacter nanhaiticus D15-8W]|uniref:Uncharacterized protein n=1 Tax=Marinobacter nanhaiticus D15-8W TaxID=626887 RepID=N6W9P3_9GAMM|nr:hypothetical protein [Marinobacter nanhaiticus]ENO16999.1 hypothetical protein J057_01129 [Marinobacter nanhaiticus D15-8W]BES72005.1 hypothetical protein RE428_30230 [Marinobacter nanhaiticus D15-8W]